jgi:thiol-disulfide isomerase/thioredoxin
VFSFLFWVTYLALWMLVVLLSSAVFFLYRHHGRMLLSSREGRANQGLDHQQQLPKVGAQDLTGEMLHLGQPSRQPLFIFFASTTCTPCKEAREALGAFAEKYQPVIETLLICAGDRQEVAEFAASLPDAIRVVPDPRNELFVQFRVSSTPFALIADQERIVHGKGMPVMSEQFEWFVEQLRNSTEQVQATGFVPITSVEVK